MRVRLLLVLSVTVAIAAACGDRPPDKPKPGTGFQGFSSGSSFGSLVQTDDKGNSNSAILGDTTPPVTDGGVVQTGDGYQNFVGITAVQH